MRELLRQLPAENVVYFGDTARVPYGPKSPDTVRRYAREITGFLHRQGVKAVVVACNTATAHALDALRDDFDVPVVGVIEPGARAAARATSTHAIGVIGTAGTIASGAYERAIRAADPAARVSALPCPLFVPLAEEGWLDHPVADLVAREYLAPLAADEIDTLVLGCTHYPLLRHAIARAVGPAVRLIDSAAETAAETASMLAARGLAAGGAGTAPRQHRFIASDSPDQFLRLGRRFLGAAIDRVETFTLG